MTTFGQRLLDAAAGRGRLCVGIDPHASLLQAWGLTDDVAGLAEFSRRCVEAFSDTAALVKPQVAFYERFGSAGFAVLEDTLAALRETGCLTVADAKRGDIGSTMAGYAEAWLGEGSPLRADAVTVSPYLGVGALAPVLDLAEENAAGVFVLAATSNPEAVALQSQTGADGRTIAQQVVDECARRNAAHAEQGATGNIGVVVGATLTQAPDLSALNGPVLMPGVGAQGGSADDVDRIAAGVAHLAFPNISRAVLSAGPRVADLRESVRAAAEDFPGQG
ncbi:orotidine-5'-phosphate decarboxylase [Corynebacterium halotolerans]|uniref:Orotidine 5'-phosphate decarboxylase n=1 Tax=Corynebacterium halotolerans YIM 70093 = DSM 44683 TaxID=1121362 RepID=M1NYJ3_9CORY|nr:orotidine-5'-phosphate decarboxylase [Corynebacterium halotolerans]AGF72565.1 orotidine 5'-phosphate decarboxylase [Corynebacterium halotolerans YIM 70093 = DSM 44683]